MSGWRNRQARNAMMQRLRTDSEFDQFLLDHFDEDVLRVIPSSSADRLARENALLQKVGAEPILRALGGPRYTLRWLGLGAAAISLLLVGSRLLVGGLGPRSGKPALGGSHKAVAPVLASSESALSPPRVTAAPALVAGEAAMAARPPLGPVHEPTARSAAAPPLGSTKAKPGLRADPTLSPPPNQLDSLRRLQFQAIEACRQHDEAKARRLFQELTKSGDRAMSGAVAMACDGYRISL